AGQPKPCFRSWCAGCARWRSACASSRDTRVTDAPGIHPSAIVDPHAELEAGVRIGPYSVIGPEVRIGAGAEIGAHVVLEGRVTLGARCRIGHGAIIGGEPQDLKFTAGAPPGGGTRAGDSVTGHAGGAPAHPGRDPREH